MITAISEKYLMKRNPQSARIWKSSSSRYYHENNWKGKVVISAGTIVLD